MSKLIDKLNTFISKVGIDKVLHDSVGGMITAMIIGLYAVFAVDFGIADCLWAIALSVVIVFSISWLKEKLDVKADWKDLAAGMTGCFKTSIVFFLVTFVKSILF